MFQIWKENTKPIRWLKPATDEEMAARKHQPTVEVDRKDISWRYLRSVYWKDIEVEMVLYTRCWIITRANISLDSSTNENQKFHHQTQIQRFLQVFIFNINDYMFFFLILFK